MKHDGRARAHSAFVKAMHVALVIGADAALIAAVGVVMLLARRAQGGTALASAKTA